MGVRRFGRDLSNNPWRLIEARAKEWVVGGASRSGGAVVAVVVVVVEVVVVVVVVVMVVVVVVVVVGGPVCFRRLQGWLSPRTKNGAV